MKIPRDAYIWNHHGLQNGFTVHICIQTFLRLLSIWVTLFIVSQQPLFSNAGIILFMLLP